MNERLTFTAFKALSDNICERLAIKPLGGRLLSALYTGEIDGPVISNGDFARLWTDRDYIAYQINTGDVKYVYITLNHIIEENEAVRETRSERHSSYRLPKDIEKEFGRAKKKMRAEGSLFTLL